MMTIIQLVKSAVDTITTSTENNNKKIQNITPINQSKRAVLKIRRRIYGTSNKEQQI